jgi:hypothetical protein
VDFVAGNSKKLPKMGLEGKISWLPNLETFNSDKLKNKKCVHTWANGTGYIHYIDDAGIVVGSATPLLSSACWGRVAFKLLQCRYALTCYITLVTSLLDFINYIAYGTIRFQITPSWENFSS